MRRYLPLLLFLLVSFGFSTSVYSEEELKLNQVKNFGFQLQKLSLWEIRNSSFDLIVIEPFLASDNTKTYSYSQVSLMKNRGNPEKRKIVLAYISIGEAETYRNYWKKEWDPNPPAWLGKENKAWKGNYKVRYWNPEWQKLILTNLDLILEAGFDGIYMDIIDANYYWSIPETYGKQKEERLPEDPYKNRKLAVERMVDWIKVIADYSREGSKHARKNFLIFPQNGEDMILYLSKEKVATYWDKIDGIGVEDLFYYGDKAEDNPRKVDQYRLKILQQFPARNKTVLSIDYLTRKDFIHAFYKEARKYKFIPYATIRALDSLPTHK